MTPDYEFWGQEFESLRARIEFHRKLDGSSLLRSVGEALKSSIKTAPGRSYGACVSELSTLSQSRSPVRHSGMR